MIAVIPALSGLPTPIDERCQRALEHVHLHQRREGALCRQGVDDLAFALELTAAQLATVVEELVRRKLLLRHIDAWALSGQALAELRAQEAGQ